MSSKSLSASLEPKTISQLNDDCLFEIFTYLNHLELSAFADTCTRFRDLAIDYFLRSKLEFVRFGEYFRLDDDDNERKRNLFLVRRMVEHFGRFIVKVHCGSYVDGLVVPLAQCPNLIEILFQDTKISDRTASRMRPLIERLQTLTICSGGTSVILWRLLPFWAVELRYLRLASISLISESFARSIHSQFVHQCSFKKLVALSHEGKIRDARALEYLVRCSPELREIRIDSNTLMYKGLLENVPQLEALNIYYDEEGYLPGVGAIARFSQIKSFTASGTATRIEKIVRGIGDFGISLKHLYLRMVGSNRNDNSAWLLGNILKLNQLEELVIQRISYDVVHDSFFEYDAQRIEALKKQSVREFVMQLGCHTAAERIANQIFSRFDVLSDLNGHTTVLHKKPLDA